MDNHLSVKTSTVQFSVSGDTEFIEQSYEAVRTLILERFVDATKVARQTQPSPPMNTDVNLAADFSEEVTHISFIACNDIYRKVYFVTPAELSETPFGQSIDFVGVQNIYFDRELQPEFEKHITLGKALWRELTTAGRTAIRNAQ